MAAAHGLRIPAAGAAPPRWARLTPAAAGQEIARLLADPGQDKDAYLLSAAGLSPAP